MRASAVAGIVFANTNDSSMEKLTEMRSMASLPFGGRYRLIDFSLSNLVNAGVTSVGIITKENYRSLMDHVGNGIYWDLDRKNGGLYILPPYSTSGVKRYNGTVDALYGALNYIDRCNADYIVLCNADTVANIDIKAAVKGHIANNADVTLVYHHGKPPVCNDEMFTLEVEDSGRIKKMNFGETTESEADFFIGVTVISRQLLKELVCTSYMDGQTNFNEDVLTSLIDKLKIYGFCHKEFVAVFNSMKAYYEANMQLLKAQSRGQLFTKGRPVYTKTRDDMPTRYGTKAEVKNSLIADGCVIKGTVKNSVIFRGVTVEKGAVVENSILMQSAFVGENANVDNVIADKNVVIGAGKMLKGTNTEAMFIEKNQVL